MAMNWLEIVFWSAAACVFFAYFGYAGILFVVARARGRPIRRQLGFRTSVSFVVAAYNEEDRVLARLGEWVALLEATQAPGEVILVSDGSTDDTAEAARTFAQKNVRVLVLDSRQGKAAALNAGAAAASNEILVFGDMRQRWDPESLTAILENFADPTVGAVSGDLVLETAPGVMAGLGLYWRYEKWLRRQESEIHSTVGVTGAICAVRRELFPPIPVGTILDDVYWPLLVAMRGLRVIHEHRALAFDRLPTRPSDEFRRKVRTLAGNFQLVTRLPSTLLPWRNPLWLQFMSHKLLRLTLPWAQIAMLLSCLLLGGALYHFLWWCQMSFYAVALAGNVRAIGTRIRFAAAAGSVMVLNLAAWLAFWVWLSGRAGQCWSKVTYNAAR
jgi:poly-beta-1,6-N-acetyl-D-glucosamine synthase